MQKRLEWLKQLLPDEDVVNTPTHGGLLETLLWHLSSLYVNEIKMSSDQWVGVWTEGTIANKWKVKTFIQGDTYLIAVAETYRWWKAKYKELTGSEYDE